MNSAHYRVHFLLPTGEATTMLNWNESPEHAVKEIKTYLGVENTKDWVDSCVFTFTEEVIPDPDNKYAYIKKGN